MLLGTSIFMDTHYCEHPAAFINTQATIMNQHPILLQTPTIMAFHYYELTRLLWTTCCGLDILHL